MTPERENKFRRVLNHRQPSLTVIFENVHDPHNISAVLRSCDSVGVKEIFIINTTQQKFSKLGKKSSSSASKWIDIRLYFSVEDCFAEVKKNYKNIFGTQLTTESKSLYELNLTEPVALVFGNEKSGISNEAMKHCTGNFIIPQVGMIESLNISVACAVSLYEAFRQRQLAGMYQSPSMPQPDLENQLANWSLLK